MHDKRIHPRTNMRCRIRITHESFGEIVGQTRDLSDGGVYVAHPQLGTLSPGTRVSGQVQGLPVPAPVLTLEVMRVDPEGAGLRFVSD